MVGRHRPKLMLQSSVFLFILFLVVPQLFSQPVDIRGAFADSTIVWKAFDLTGTFPDTSDWIRIDKRKYFSLFPHIYTDSTFYSQALGGDSLDFDVHYELHTSEADLAKAVKGYWRYRQTDALKILDFTTADTLNGGQWYQSMHSPVDSSGNTSGSTIDILRQSPAEWIRFILRAGAKQKINSVHLKFDLVYRRQS